MAEFVIDVTELEVFGVRLKQIAAQKTQPFGNTVRKYGIITRREARNSAPYDEGRTSGVHLRNTILDRGLKIRGASVEASWEVDAPHGPPQEYGFIHYISGKFVPAANGGQGYVRPTLKRNRVPFINELSDIAGDQFKISRRR